MKQGWELNRNKPFCGAFGGFLRDCGISIFDWFLYNIGPAHCKTNKMTCAPSEDSDQPRHPPSLISLRSPHEASLGSYRFRKNVGKSNFSEQVRKLINRYKRFGYSLDIMRQTACLVVNPIIVDGYASLFNCTTAVRASDSMTASS